MLDKGYFTKKSYLTVDQDTLSITRVLHVTSHDTSEI